MLIGKAFDGLRRRRSNSLKLVGPCKLSRKRQSFHPHLAFFSTVSSRVDHPQTALAAASLSSLKLAHASPADLTLRTAYQTRRLSLRISSAQHTPLSTSSFQFPELSNPPPHRPMTIVSHSTCHFSLTPIFQSVRSPSPPFSYTTPATANSIRKFGTVNFNEVRGYRTRIQVGGKRCWMAHNRLVTYVKIIDVVCIMQSGILLMQR